MLESVYENVLAHELEKRGLKVVTQQPIPVVYETVQLEVGFRADLIVGGKVIVEIKSIEAIAPIHLKQPSDIFAADQFAFRFVSAFQC